jgi:hypothetical protein
VEGFTFTRSDLEMEERRTSPLEMERTEVRQIHRSSPPESGEEEGEHWSRSSTSALGEVDCGRRRGAEDGGARKHSGLW